MLHAVCALHLPFPFPFPTAIAPQRTAASSKQQQVAEAAACF